MFFGGGLLKLPQNSFKLWKKRIGSMFTKTVPDATTVN